MILFEEDWAKYPTAIVDTSTSNQSWVRLAAVYRSMGITNHKFLLALVNPNLKGIDPHDPMLTREQIVAISIECYLNPWYFFREVARAPAQSGRTTSPLLANRGNICLFWCFFNHVRITLIQIRQTGKSFNTDILMTYLLNVACMNTTINLMTKDDQLRRSNITRLKDIAECLPYYLKQGTRHDANNGEELTIKALGNEYKTHVPQMNKMRALNAGRGLTSAIFQVDEGPFQPNIDIALPAALPAMGAAVERAKANNEPYGVIFTTTAGKLSEPSGEFFYDLLMESYVWGEHLFDCKNQEDLHEVLIAGSSGKVVAVNATFSHRQLGYTDEWLRAKIKESLQKGDAAERDFLNMWTPGTEGSPFSPEVAKRINSSQRDPNWVEVDPKFKFSIRWYVPRNFRDHMMAKSKYIMGLDTSDASGGDAIGVTIVDAESMYVIAAATLNNLNLYSFVEWIADMLEKYPSITLMPERKSSAVSIIDGLLKLLPNKGMDPFRRIFNQIVQEPVKHADKYEIIRRGMHSRDPKIYDLYKSYFGFVTAGSGTMARDRLFGDVMQFAAGKFAERTNDKTLVSQLLGLTKKNGRIDHGNGKHDDMVVAWLISMWLLRLGHNLQFYGIDPSIVLRDTPEDREMTELERRDAERQREVREQITKLVDQLSKTSDDAISEKLSTQIRYLDKFVVTDSSEAFSIQELISKATEMRKRRKSSTSSGYSSSSREQDVLRAYNVTGYQVSGYR